MRSTKVSSQDLIKEFSIATIKGDMQAITNILDENGVFEIQSEDKKHTDTNKYNFIEWYS